MNGQRTLGGLFNCCVLFLIQSPLANSQEVGSALPTRLKLMGGLVVPVGDFASTSGATAGYAKTGFGFGAEVTTEPVKSLEFGVPLSFDMLGFDNATAEDQFRSLFGTYDITLNANSWILVSGAANVGVNLDISPLAKMYWRAKLGVLYGKSPELTGTAGGIAFSQSSSTATAIGYGLGAGLLVNERIDIGVQHFVAEPEYAVTAEAGGFVQQGKVKQPSSTVKVMAGYVIPLN